MRQLHVRDGHKLDSATNLGSSNPLNGDTVDGKEIPVEILKVNAITVHDVIPNT